MLRVAERWFFMQLAEISTWSTKLNSEGSGNRRFRIPGIGTGMPVPVSPGDPPGGPPGGPALILRT